MSVPQHLGIIPDGNRRWAKERGLSTLEGHRRGMQVGQEIALAAFERGVKYYTKSLIEAGVKPEDVTPELVTQHMYGPDVPPVDLIIRTSGEQRTSGFMMWRSEYAEMYFTEKNWPAFEVEDLEAALGEYEARQRRFGK
jgi:undecaprenyl pyrophosphate synthase